MKSVQVSTKCPVSADSVHPPSPRRGGGTRGHLDSSQDQLQRVVDTIPFRSLPRVGCPSCGQIMILYEIGQTIHPGCGS